MRTRALGPKAIYEALASLEVEPYTAFRDPVLATRQAVTAEASALERFLSIVLDEPAKAPRGEDELRLFVAGVLALLLPRWRRMREMPAPSGPAVLAGRGSASKISVPHNQPTGETR